MVRPCFGGAGCSPLTKDFRQPMIRIPIEGAMTIAYVAHMSNVRVDPAAGYHQYSQ